MKNAAILAAAAGRLTRVTRDTDGSLHRGHSRPRPHAFLMPMPEPKRNGVARSPGSGPNRITPLGGGWWAFDKPAHVTRVNGVGWVENPTMVEPGQRVRIVPRGGRYYVEVGSPPGRIENTRRSGGLLVVHEQPDASSQGEDQDRQSDDAAADQSHGPIVSGRVA